MHYHFGIALITLILLVVNESAEAANILGIFTFDSRSHIVYHQALMQSLADAGHNITFIGPVSSSQSVENFTYIDSRFAHTENRSSSTPNFYDLPLERLVETFVEITENNCYNFLNIKEVKELLDLSTANYDVMFVQMLVMHECYLPIAKKFRIPVIGTFSMRPTQAVDHGLGNSHPLMYPFLISSNPVRMSFSERVRNVYSHLKYEFCMRSTVPKLKKFYRLHFPDYNLQRDKEISFLFANWHPTMYPKATVPTIAEIGGVHIKPAKPLPSNIQKFVDEAENGVIVFSMGSTDSRHILNGQLKSIFSDAFAQIPQRVIWKDDGEIQNLSDNVLLMGWLPQRDILAHKNIQMFITHAGVHGVMEAIYEAKPMVMIPMFCDQLSNAAILADSGVGVRLTLQTLTKEKLIEAINTVANDKSYRETIRTMSRMFKDRPMSPQETVVYWTEYVLRYGGTKLLRPAIADMPLYSYLLLDILLFLVICSVMAAIVLYYAIRSIFTTYKRTKQLKKE